MILKYFNRVRSLYICTEVSPVSLLFVFLIASSSFSATELSPLLPLKAFVARTTLGIVLAARISPMVSNLNPFLASLMLFVGS